MYEPKFLTKIDKEVNNYKYYKMIADGSCSSFTVEYGRMGEKNFQTHTYPISDWNKKYNEKVKKGYVDHTELMEEAITPVSNTSTNEIVDKYHGLPKSIATIIKRLYDFSNKTIQANYKVNSFTVTQAMVDKAQKLIDELVIVSKQTSYLDDKGHIDAFNDVLLNLFETIPRKMKRVADNLAISISDFDKIIIEEQSLLDTMQGQVYKPVVVEKSEVDKEMGITNTTILDEMGIRMSEVNDSDIELIKEMLGNDANRYVNAWKVCNIETEKKFGEYKKKNNIINTKLLWHGTRSSNVYSILKSSLLLRPSNVIITGKLYGMGIYFAPKAQKSIGYTSVAGSYWARGNNESGFLIVFETAYGTPYDVYDYNSKYGSMDYNTLQSFKKGANCLHAHAGASMGGYSSLKNDEIIFYNENAMTMRYLVEIK